MRFLSLSAITIVPIGICQSKCTTYFIQFLDGRCHAQGMIAIQRSVGIYQGFVLIKVLWRKLARHRIFKLYDLTLGIDD
ncbi:hypothetical protein BGW37DRAFT_508138 [Umbelopsis sp. PMI_123]|nr:hypothetical protein BGW37DRAFT_508138 [Umbelopsis sp. PMI_123]